MILKPLVVGPYMSNCYIVGSESTNAGIIIDPGAEHDVILKAVAQSGLKINLIVATHGHIDHVGAVSEVSRRLDVPFAMHPAERRSGGPYDRVPAPDREFAEADQIDIGADLSFTVRHTPGHSPGGIALIGPGLVFSGDTLFQFSIGRTDFPGGSYSQLMTAIFDKLLALPDETVVYCGHGPSTTIGVERKANPFVRDWARRNTQHG